MTKPLRCAVYTRKSSEEGLEQEFNSLHAQREACEAYIKSQKHEGWTLIKAAYDDGGISGGTMQRPGLQQLLADINAGLIDIVVVYKVDRLTRALADFARIVELFDKHNVSFVSVTQQFNTTSSMGRLTLNVLLSFAQFEREVTGERIRDKVKASKAKGMWMGGMVPLGYQIIDKKLIPHPGDADTLRTIFTSYLEVGNVRLLVDYLAKRGIRTRPKSSEASKRPGGGNFCRGALYAILNNPVYIGKTRHGDKLYDGQHDAILDQDLWDRVQAKLSENAALPRYRHRTTKRHLLLKKLFHGEGARLTSTQTIKNGRRYRYYISEPKMVPADPHAWRLSADKLEDLVFERVKGMLTNPSVIAKSAREAGLASVHLHPLIDACRDAAKCSQVDLIDRLVERVIIRTDLITITLNATTLLSIEAKQEFAQNDEDSTKHILHLTETQPIQLRRRFNEMRIVMLAPELRSADIDDSLVRTIANGHLWFQQWCNGEIENLKDIANREGVAPDYVTDVIRLAFLSPDITDTIIRGHQPPELTLRKLLKLNTLSVDWDEQVSQLGCG
jgi:site-specific DNA recombinase